ncbi:MAG: FadR family transcriptional regulator [Anaerolineales bacterium]|nr:FadR family transcriptional regulator [Anaerolineales bacterium]
MLPTKLDPPFLSYLAESAFAPEQKLPTLNEISSEMNISVGKLREQLEVARSLGLVSVRPRVGMQREPFDFSAVILKAVLFSLTTGEATFAQFSQMRRALEESMWNEAVKLLTDEDKAKLQQLINRAWKKLGGKPIRIPNEEHRALHLTIFNRLDNPFVQGLLAAYWDAYEASELTRFNSLEYWVEVWHHHQEIVDAICSGDFDRGRECLIKHFSLLRSVPVVDIPEVNAA